MVKQWSEALCLALAIPIILVLTGVLVTVTMIRVCVWLAMEGVSSLSPERSEGEKRGGD